MCRYWHSEATVVAAVAVGAVDTRLAKAYYDAEKPSLGQAGSVERPHPLKTCLPTAHLLGLAKAEQ